MRHETQPYDQVQATLEVVSAGIGRTGLSPTVAIRRLSDSLWLQSGGGSWGAGFATNAMTALDATNLPGLYSYAVPGGQLSLGAGYVMRIAETSTGLLETVLVHTVDGGSAPTAGAVADAVWTETLADHSGVGGSTAEALAGVTVSAIADAVWDETAASHTTAGSMGELLNDAGVASSPADIADAVWDEVVSGHQTTNTFGRILTIAHGLVQGNKRIKSPTYDADGRLLTCDLVLYPTATDAQNDTNALDTFAVTSTYDGSGNLQSLLSRN